GEGCTFVRRAPLPERPEPAPRRLLHVEPLGGELGAGGPPLRLRVFCLEARVLEHLHDGVGIFAHLVGWRAGSRGRAGHGETRESDAGHDGGSDHENKPSPAQYMRVEVGRRRKIALASLLPTARTLRVPINTMDHFVPFPEIWGLSGSCATVQRSGG